MDTKIQKGLYDMTSVISIEPMEVFNNREYVSLHIDGKLVGEYPTYTQACEEVICIVNMAIQS